MNLNSSIKSDIDIDKQQSYRSNISANDQRLMTRSRSSTLLPQAIETRQREFQFKELKHNVLIVDMSNNNNNNNNNNKMATFTEQEMTVQQLYDNINDKIKLQQNIDCCNWDDYSSLHILNIRNLMLKSISSKCTIEKDKIMDKYSSLYLSYDDSVTFAKFIVIFSIEDINFILTFKTLFLLVPPTFDRNKLDAIKEAFSDNDKCMLKDYEFEYRVYDRILLIFKNQVDNDINIMFDMWKHIKSTLITIEKESIILSSSFEMDLRHVLNKLKKLEIKIKKYKTFIENLLNGDDNDTMRFMSLHQFLNTNLKSKSEVDYRLIKILFEEYLVYHTAFLNTVTSMRTSLETRLEILKLRLDSSRNELGLIQNYITLLFVMVTFASFIANGIIFNLYDNVFYAGITYFAIICGGWLIASFILRKFKIIPTYIIYKKRV